MEPERVRWFMPVLKEGASWAVFLWGIVIGVLITTLFAGSSVDLSSRRDWAKLLGTVLLGLIPLLASILALRNRRQSAYLFLLAAVLVVAILVMIGLVGWVRFEFDISFLQAFGLVLAGIAGFLFLPGLFWLLTDRRGWRPLIGRGVSAENLGRQPVIFNSLLLLLLLSGCAFGSLYFPLGMELNCYKGQAPVFAQTSRRHVVFTGRVISLGRPVQGWGCPWALIRVERVYWGLPRWMSGIVFVRGFFRVADSGQEYFVDAHRSNGLLTRFFPVVDEYACCHSAILTDAKVDLRVLEEGPPKSGVRVIGRLYRIMPVQGWRYVSGVTVVVTGPRGSVSVVTDEDGIYDLKDLPPGSYSLLIGSTEYGRADLKAGSVWARDLDLLHPHVH